MLDQVKPRKNRLRQMGQDYSSLGHVMSGQARLGHFRSGKVRLSHVRSR
jgi:hypothetical protein